MKQNFETPSKRRAGASGRGRSAASGRFQLGRALGNALSGSFDVFEGRLGGGAWRGARAAARPHADRLREVLDRDRALIAAERIALAAPETDGAEAKAEHSLAAPVADGPETTPTLEMDGAGANSAHSLASPETGAAEAEPRGAGRATALPPVPPALAAALAKEAPRALCDEPIRTRTMARLLAGQGYRKRALSIYEHLLACADDPALRAEADALRRPGA